VIRRLAAWWLYGDARHWEHVSDEDLVCIGIIAIIVFVAGMGVVIGSWMLWML